MQELLDLLEGAVEWRHEGAAREVHDTDVLRLERVRAPALARRALWIIGRADQEWLLINELEHIPLVPDVITRCDDIGTAAVELIERLACEALAARGVLAIDDDDVNSLLLAQLRRDLAECPSARVADDISYQHDFQRISLFLLHSSVSARQRL